jgi:cytochrome c-type biogenesis protein
LSIAYQDNVNGALLLSFYSLGLGLPFLLVGFFIGKISNYLFKLNKMIMFFKFFTGILIILTGIFILNGSIQSFGFKLNEVIPSFELLLL